MKAAIASMLLGVIVLSGCDEEPATGADAGTSTEDAGGDSYDCDPKHVSCESLPPECPAGFVAAVAGDCWDACVPQLECEPIVCSETGPEPQCPPDWGCVGAECRPPR